MATKIKLHPETPHIKRVFEIVDHLRKDQVILMPTDSGYALACRLEARKAIEQIKTIRRLPDTHHFSLLTSDLSKISDLGYMDDDTFKLIKRVIPASVTFILKANKIVPKLLVNTKKQTIGIRVPDHEIAQAILSELNEPLFVTTAKLPGMELEDQRNPDLFQRHFDKLVDIIVNDEQDVFFSASSVINLSEGKAEIIREGNDFDKVQEALTQSQISLAD